ncbi:MAG TPA: transcription termination factor NusA [Candidatus Saccharimonadales bacterium]|jgi:N utilization substance protein A|nr:transcription termination factor NusA [Candidatus Saccharimonadales bacterium]
MELDMKQLAVAIRTIAEEKNLPENVVQDAVEQALAAAYRKDYGDREQEVRVNMNLNTGQVDAYITKNVVAKVKDELIEIDVKDAQKIKKDVKDGDTVEVHQSISQFGRVAAQTAKQVILQKLRESERDIIMNEYEDKIGTVINGIVARVEPRIVRVDLGKAQGIMPQSEQIQSERYYPGQRIKVFLKDVEKGFRGPQLVVSRGSKDFVIWLFKNEVPEMENGSVEIKEIAREGGVRTKLAVTSNTPGVDPVGTFVGGHGTRVNAVMSEIGDQEKIDIIVWASDPKEYIINALSPTKVTRVELNEQAKKAVVFVPEDQLSIAIGKNGQNVRLASKLTGYELDISSDVAKTDNSNQLIEDTQTQDQHIVETKTVTPKLKKKEQLESSLLEAINDQAE